MLVCTFLAIQCVLYLFIVVWVYPCQLINFQYTGLVKFAFAFTIFYD